MSIPTTFSPVKQQDFSLIPIPVKKSFSLSSANLTNTSSGYNLVDGYYTSLKLPIGSRKADNDPRNSFDNSYKHVVWQAYNHLYYKDPYNPYSSFEHSNRNYTWKFLNRSASILSCPYLDYGEQIDPGSVQITSSFGYYIADDKNGNLYVKSINTSSFAKRYNLVAYWGFNSEFKKFKYNFGTAEKDTCKYISHTFEPENYSGVRNIRFEGGVKINNTSSGMSAAFTGQSYIMTHNRDEFNFDSSQDFTLSCWIRIPVSQSVTQSSTNAILSKNGAIYKPIFGDIYKYTPGEENVLQKGVSASLQSESTDVYPYAFEVYNQTHANSGKILFKRSDGITTLSLASTSSFNDGTFHHIAAVRNGTLVSLYVDGVKHASGSDGTKHPINNYVLMFGSRNFEYKHAYSGSIDEIRIYNYAVPQAGIQTLAKNTDQSLYQTGIVGNVFYRKGNIIISSLDPYYQRIFNNTWTLNYNGSHTIYQYEALCRAKKGSFNMTMNPTARKSPNSDLYSDDITGSLLMPYATSIGLYSSQGDLIAVGKLSQPTQMRGDVDINFLVKWDV